MLGSCFLKRLSGDKDFEMFAFDKEGLDISDGGAVERVFEKISPDFVINTAAYTAVDDCETNRETALNVNGDSLVAISKLCKKENAVLVHFSTDYVFDGNSPDGYEENSPTSPINFYGQSKLLGEENIMHNMSDYYIIRTSWLFGENGTNFVDTMLRLSKEKPELSVVGDQFGSPTYSNDLCEAVLSNFASPFLDSVIPHHDRKFEEASAHSSKLPFGIYHLTNFGITSWYDFACEIFKIVKSDIPVKKVTSDEFKRPAKRPKNSVLKNTKLDFSLRSWQDALGSYLDLTFLK